MYRSTYVAKSAWITAARSAEAHSTYMHNTKGSSESIIAMSVLYDDIIASIRVESMRLLQKYYYKKMA